MNLFIGILLSLSVSGGLMIILLCALKPFIRNRVTKAWQHYVWIVVILRLLLPFSAEVNLIGSISNYYAEITSIPSLNTEPISGDNISVNQPEGNGIGFHAPAGAGKEPVLETIEDHESENIFHTPTAEFTAFTGQPNEELIPDSSQPDAYANVYNKSPALTQNIERTDIGNAPDKAAGFNSIPQITSAVNGLTKFLLSNIWSIWFLGFVFMLSRMPVGYLRLSFTVKKYSSSVSEEVLSVYRECCAILGIRSKPPLYTSRFAKTPMLTGLFHPHVILPDREYSTSEMKYILLHELNHMKKRDLLYKWIVRFTLCIHWFNPLVYLMTKQINRACELACDEAVIKSLNSDQKKEYGIILITAASANRAIGPALAINENKKDLKERLTAIMKFKKRGKLTTFTSFILLTALIMTSVFTGAWAAESTPQPVKESEVVVKDHSDSGKSDGGYKAYTVDELAELIYEQAKLVELDFNDITELDISLLTENLIIERGGESVHVRFYQWYDDQYILSETEGVLSLKYVDDGRLVKIGDLSTKPWLNEVLKYLNRGINPENPEDKQLTVVVTVPEGVELTKTNANMISGYLNVSGLNTNECSLSNISGGISVNDCYAQNLDISTISGGLYANNISGQNALVSDVSGGIRADNISFNETNINSLSGMVFLTGSEGMLTVSSQSGSVSIIDPQNADSIDVSTFSGTVNIVSDNANDFRIKFKSSTGQLQIGDKSYNKEADLNQNASKTINIDTKSGGAEIYDSNDNAKFAFQDILSYTGEDIVKMTSELLGSLEEYAAIADMEKWAEEMGNLAKEYTASEEFKEFENMADELEKTMAGMADTAKAWGSGSSGFRGWPWAKITDETTYTVEQLSLLVYDEAKLIEQTFENISKIDLSFVDENVIIKRGGENVQIRLYQWYDGQFEITGTDGVLSAKYFDYSRNLKADQHTHLGYWLPEVLKHLGKAVNPENPDATCGTVVVTIPEDIDLKSITHESIIGGMSISGLSADNLRLETIGGAVDINNCNVQEMSINAGGGTVFANKISGQNAKFESTSGQISVSDDHYNNIDINNISGDITADGGESTLNTSNLSGSIKLLNTQNRDSLNVDTHSGRVDIEVANADDYQIKFDSFSGSLTVDNSTYKNKVSMNTNASKRINIKSLSGASEIRSIQKASENAAAEEALSKLTPFSGRWKGEVKTTKSANFDVICDVYISDDIEKVMLSSIKENFNYFPVSWEVKGNSLILSMNDEANRAIITLALTNEKTLSGTYRQYGDTDGLTLDKISNTAINHDFYRNIPEFTYSERLEQLTDFTKYADDGVTIPFTYDLNNRDGYEALIAEYDLDGITSGLSDVDLMLALMNWVCDNFEHNGNSGMPEARDANAIVAYCKENSSAINCRGLSILLSEMLRVYGIPAKHITCMPKEKYFNDCHVVVHAYSKKLGQWIMLDPTYRLILQDKSGNYVNLPMLREALVDDTKLVANKNAGWNGTKFNMNNYREYMTKNTFRFSSATDCYYGAEEGYKGNIENMLVPLNYDEDKAERTTTSDEAFWALPY